MHVYLTARHFDLTDELRAYAEKRLVEPIRSHNSLDITRIEIQLQPETERGGQIGCHVLVEIKGHNDLNVREIASDVHAAIDLANERVMPLLTDLRDKKLTLARHPKKYSLGKLARALGWRRAREQS